MSKQILTIFAIMSWVKSELPFVKKPTKPPNCAPFTLQLSDLLVFVCTEIGVEEEMRDACAGCFQRASKSNNSQPSLTELRNCGETYLTGTAYEECSGQIESDSRVGVCVGGYCKFVSCIRRVNSNLLIAHCYEQASADNDADFEEEQIILVKNITSCILAQSRCAPYNPISGQRQTNTITTTTYDTWGKPRTNTVSLYNALQITPEGDLRIIQLPGNLKIQNQFCTNQANLLQSPWMEYSC